jgi:transposase
MKFIQGYDRNQIQLFPVSLEESIGLDNEVRLIDMFVESLPLKKMGFGMEFIENGRPAYHPADLLKLFIYGYLNKIRSSRDLEKECKRNIEVMWLLKGLSPDHNTISNFRRDNSKAIRKVFQATVKVARHFNLIGGKLLAGDSTKLRAQNSKKNNYNQKKIDRHLEYIQNKLDEYQKALAESDGDDKQQIEKEIAKHEQRKEEYKQLENQLNESGEKQISTSDPESRQLITRNNITEVAYNVQSTVDAEHNIPIDFKVTNENDSKAMGKMLPRAKSILGHNQFTSLYDKGYHTGSEFAIADRLGLEVLVAVPGMPSSSNAPNPKYNVENFIYNSDNDCYICPQGHELHSNGTWYKRDAAQFRQFKTPMCKSCPVRPECTTSIQNGKIVQRSEYQHYIEQNKQRVAENQNYYRRRQAIVEHPYGTIKRQWGFNYIITKRTIQRATADVGLMFTAYNLRRIINIIGIEAFRSYLIALFAVLGAIMGSLEAFGRGLKNLFPFCSQNLAYRRMVLIPIFGGQFCSKTEINGGY